VDVGSVESSVDVGSVEAGSVELVGDDPYSVETPSVDESVSVGSEVASGSGVHVDVGAVPASVPVTPGSVGVGSVESSVDVGSVESSVEVGSEPSVELGSAPSVGVGAESSEELVVALGNSVVVSSCPG
jgi:hypothetical protein